MLMAEGIVEHCVKQSMIAIGGKCKFDDQIFTLKKSGIPEPESMSVEFLARYRSHVSNILKKEVISLSKIAANNHYPTINHVKGAEPARKFTNGLCHMGFGELTEVKNEKNKIISFRRYHPYDSKLSIEKRERVKYLCEKLNIKMNMEEDDKENTISSSQALDNIMAHVNNLKQ